MKNWLENPQQININLSEDMQKKVYKNIQDVRLHIFQHCYLLIVKPCEQHIQKTKTVKVLCTEQKISWIP